MFLQVCVGVFPCSTMLDDLVCSRSPELSYHQRCGGCWYDDSALQVEGTSRVDSSETGITTTGSKDVRTSAFWKLCKTAENVVADTSVVA